MRSIIIILAIIGVVMVAIGFVQNNQQCPPPVIQYRYIPKTFTEEQQVQTPLLAMSSVYNMFEKDDPWYVERSYATQEVKQANPV